MSWSPFRVNRLLIPQTRSYSRANWLFVRLWRVDAHRCSRFGVVLLALDEHERVLVPALLLDQYLLRALLRLVDVDALVQVLAPKRELVPKVRSRRPDPPVTLPLPLGAHVFDRNAVPAQLPRVVRVRVVPPRQTARLEHQVRRVRVQVEHLHSLDAQRAAEVNGEDDKRTFVFAEHVLLDLPKLPSLFNVILARLELNRPRGVPPVHAVHVVPVDLVRLGLTGVEHRPLLIHQRD